MDLAALEPGQTLCKRDVALTEERVARYLRAVGDEAAVYAELGVAPPMAVAALAMAAAMEAVALPAGAVHTGQELAFTAPAPVGVSVRCVASVGANSVRRGTRFLALDLRAASLPDGAPLVEGRASLAIAEEGGG